MLCCNPYPLQWEKLIHVLHILCTYVNIVEYAIYTIIAPNFDRSEYISNNFSDLVF